MPKLVIFNDPHYSRTPQVSRAATYAVEILEKIHQAARLAEKLGAHLGCTGDWFHRKGRVTFQEANDLLAVLSHWKDRGVGIFGLLGNHDITGSDLDAMDSRAAGALVRSGVIHLLDHGPYVLQDEDGAIHVTGTSYFTGCDANDEARIRMYGGPAPQDYDHLHVHLAHGALINRGQFFGDFTVASTLPALLGPRKPDVLVCGHLHFSEGVQEHAGPPGTNPLLVCRVGSLGRVASDDFDRQPQALILASKGRRVVARTHALGGKVKLALTPEPQEGGPPSAERAVQIQEFVQSLLEEAEDTSLTDHDELLRRAAEKLGHGPGELALAQEALRQSQ